MNSIRYLAVFAGIIALSASLAPAQEKMITATPVNYEGLKQEILKHRGKVVLVDFWGTFCPPCMAAFPKFVKMHKDHESKGLVILSVSLDQPDDEGKFAGTDKFLTRQQAPMRNLVLQDPDISWLQKFGFKGPPCYFVFDRHGRWVRFKNEPTKEIDYAEIENTVLKMLAEK